MQEIYFTIKVVLLILGMMCVERYTIFGGSFNKTAQLEELRAVSGDKVYYLRKTKDTVIDAMNDNELEYEFRKIRKKVRMKYQKMYEDGIITKTERHLLSSEEYNKIFAQKCGLEYGEEGIV